MADNLFCDNIGNTTDSLECCTISDQNSPICQTNFFNPNVYTFSNGCYNRSCIEMCQKRKSVYISDQQEDVFRGNGMGPKRRFLTCANVPAMAGYLDQKVIQQNLSDAMAPYIPDNRTNDDLRGITLAVTECLTSTCHSARNSTDCRGRCSATNLMINNTTPNIQGMNGCLYSLCHEGYNSLPYADADVIGIGVFASYIMQCMFVVILWFGLLAFHMINRRRQSQSQPQHEREPVEKHEQTPSTKSATAKHEVNFTNFLVQFHKAQCYFSATIQIASLSYDIFDIDLLVTFLLIPLATNGVLPVVFNLVLLFRQGKATMDVLFLTTACWILSSVVYWVLYSHIIPLNQHMSTDEQKYRAYQQFMYKLSSIDACGGYSALAVCPDNFHLGRDEITLASHNLRVLTPIIWTFSTVCLFSVFLGKYIKYHRGAKARYAQVAAASASGGESETETRYDDHPPFFRSRFGADVAYWLTTTCFLAGIGMQLSLLSIGTSLNMMNRGNWSFGQIVAVTIWAQPLMGYLYDELKELLWDRWRVGRIPK
ncbi:hypothetical protein EJ04DRAFT_603366 [Polyplosphaeria fusca]|uniref:Uncharacterized protein n=1 Tax=Polyplosphaeria fusca TaxID=682080 RepID=A0A9P4QV06_9PLEO|nr:hypothetical protein EJ04DRAFT_603366 [Polyplosphaeria fusca]